MDNARTYILEQAMATIYDRPDKHGRPENTFGTIADLWNAYIQNTTSELLQPADVTKMMILMKIARSANDIYDDDNPTDVAGYAENWAMLEQDTVIAEHTDLPPTALDKYDMGVSADE